MADEPETARGFNQLLGDYAKFIYAGQSYDNQAYIYCHPDFIALVSNDIKGKFDSGLMVGRGVGTIMHGPVAMYCALESIRIGPGHCLNPMLASKAASSADKPIPVLMPKPPFQIDMSKMGDAINQAIQVVRSSEPPGGSGGQAGWSGGAGGGGEPLSTDEIMREGAPIPATYNSSKCVEELKAYFLKLQFKDKQTGEVFKPWDQASVDKLMALGSRISGGKAPEVLAAVILSESGGNPRAKNPHSTATGLIQWMASTARGFGVTTAQIYKMSASEQLDLANAYYGKGVYDTFGKAYAKVFYPAILSGQYVKQGTEAYRLNSGLDHNKDGIIDLDDLSNHIRTVVLGRRGLCK